MKKFMILVLCLGVCLALCETDSWGACGGITASGNVQGNKSGWTYIGTANKGSLLRVHASGKVDFGCTFCTCVDSATAGVEGKSLIFVKAFDGLKQQLAAVPTLNPVEAAQKNINVMKSIFGSTKQPNFDQGGVWIKVVKKNGAPYIATQLYYFWEHGDGINKYGLHINEVVDVYAKAHDGGKSPDSTKSYGDNHGAYTVKIEAPSVQSAGSGGTSQGIHSALPVGQTQSSQIGTQSQSTQLGSQAPGSQQIGQTQYIPGTSPGSGGIAPGMQSAQPTGQTQYTSATGQGTRINLQLQVQNKNCTRCVKECTAGQTCVYINGSCFVSCQ
jgi:hypothetical protein